MVPMSLMLLFALVAPVAVIAHPRLFSFVFGISFESFLMFYWLLVEALTDCDLVDQSVAGGTFGHMVSV